MSTDGQYVAYYRVSTAKQGRSGLGLDAQKTVVAAFLAGNGGRVVAEYVEVESGRKKDRQQLQEAINHARITRSKLVIAKLDRLARNVSFTAALMDSGIEFVCCDLPQANRFTIHVMAALAEMEAEMISARTKAALVEARKRGVRLGNPNLGAVRGDPGRASKVWQDQAQREAERYTGAVLAAKRAGANTLEDIAAALNAGGLLTPRGCLWHASTVSRLLKRLGC